MVKWASYHNNVTNLIHFHFHKHFIVCIKLVTLLWYIMIHAQKNIKLCKLCCKKVRMLMLGSVTLRADWNVTVIRRTENEGWVLSPNTGRRPPMIAGLGTLSVTRDKLVQILWAKSEWLDRVETFFHIHAHARTHTHTRARTIYAEQL
jgi:hypothetical protein